MSFPTKLDDLPENVEFLPPSRSLLLPPTSLRPPSGSAFSPTSPCKPFIALHPDFLHIIGKSPTLRVLGEDVEGRRLFHEAGVWVKETQQVFFTSNVLKTELLTEPSGLVKGLNRLSTVTLPISAGPIATPQEWQDIPPSTAFVSSNGACLWNGKVLICDQGYGTQQPSQLVLLDPVPPYKTTPILNNFHGRPFNSLNDVVILPTPNHPGHETIWFTDPTYGYEQSCKPPPELPLQVYCFDPTSGSVRVVADGFTRPNGIAMDEKEGVCFVTDTGMISGRGVIDGSLPGTIYAFDVIFPPPHLPPTTAGPTLHNRRVFAFTDSGAPDGIKLDTHGNVYAGCFDGIHVWNKYGTLLGKIVFDREGGKAKDVCANFCFVPGRRIVAMAEDRMYLVEGLGVEGALL